MQKLPYLIAAVATLSAPIVAHSATKTAPLSPAEERQWINSVKAHKTADGRTVVEALALVEKRAHGRFKVASYDVMYDWKGQPSSVSISYWIGTKRARDLTFSDLDYPMNRNGTIAKLSFADRPTLSSLEKGADAMLAEVEEHYRLDCPADMPSDHC
ncbi:hypothetical protein [Massilia phyllosphaerae]|uniref:hypothetical protein n=1 Tax=Massilia phyllosphaerae TaxID=3106034 RepID=UPI002B1CE0AA|nr:hypothetical protein [Massilia sp. SGZ-792]